MNVLQSVTAIFRSPEAAVLVAQAVQASDLAARQGQASIQRDAAMHGHQVMAAGAPAQADGVAQRQEAREQEARARRLAKPSTPGAAPLPPPTRQRLDITV